MLLHLPIDIINEISIYLDYFTYSKLQLTCKYLYFSNSNKFFIKKADFIKLYFKKMYYNNFYDLNCLRRKGILINLCNILNYPKKYLNDKIQCISWYQHNHSYLPIGYIVEGYLLENPINTWVILDINSKKYHPLSDPFIFPKSIRIIKQ